MKLLGDDPPQGTRCCVSRGGVAAGALFMILRDYQNTALDEMRSALRRHQSVLLTMPCGSGKGSIIAYIVNACVQRGKRVIFAVHGKSLVHDMSERVTKLGIKHGVLMGSHRRERWHSVQVASIDTLHRMEHPPHADLLIADECHMSLSPTWRKTLDRYPMSKVIGMTATPTRLDGQGLGRASGGLFDAMVLGPSEQELIDMGYLVRSRVLAPPPPADLGTVKKTAGEFNTKQQASVCDKAKVIGDIVEHWRKHGFGRKTVAFGVDQAHASHIAERFRESGISFAYVDADTPDTQRQSMWNDLDRGDLMGIASVGCISVGWDHPVVCCLIAARKTASLGLWRQMLGRGSRIHPGKDHFLVLDHTGNTHYHAPYGLFESKVDWSLDGEAFSSTAQEKTDSITTCKTPVVENGIKKYPCYATFKTGPERCPYCGILLAKQVRKIEQVDGELSEVKAQPFMWPKDARPGDPRIMKSEFLELVRKQQERGYKPNYPAVAFKMKYGFFPPKRWREQSA